MSIEWRYLRVSACARHQGWGGDLDAVRWWSGGGVEQSPDASGEVAFEAADRFALALAGCDLALDIGPGGWTEVHLGERDDVDRAVQLPVTATVQAVALGLAGAGGDRGGSAVPSETGVGTEPLRAGGVTDDDRGGHDPAAGLLKQRRAVSFDQGLELCEEIALLTGDLTDPGHEPFGDHQLRAARQLGQLPGQASEGRWVLDRGRPETSFDLRGDPDQVPAQPVDHL